MKQLFEAPVYQELVKRIGALSPNQTALWGCMNVDQMLCHCADPLREALGIRPTKDLSSIFSRTLAKWVSLFLMKEWPAAKYPTSPEYDQKKDGTVSTAFENDRSILLHLLKEVYDQPQWFKFHPHPYFGSLTRKEMGLLIFRHLNHHLRQFGV